VIEVLLQRGLDVTQLRVRGLIAQREDALLRAIERERDVRRLAVRVGRDGGRGAEQSTQDRAVAHDARVPFDLDRRGHELGELAEVRRPPDAVELLAPSQLDLHGQRIDPLAALQQRLHGPVDALVPGEVEVVLPEKVGDLEDRVAVDQEAAEHLLLGRLIPWERSFGACYGHAASKCRVLATLEHTFGVNAPRNTDEMWLGDRAR
jgi:hypothetical protein